MPCSTSPAGIASHGDPPIPYCTEGDHRERRAASKQRHYKRCSDTIREKARVRNRLKLRTETTGERDTRKARQREASARYRAANRTKINYNAWKHRPVNAEWLRRNAEWYAENNVASVDEAISMLTCTNMQQGGSE